MDRMERDFSQSQSQASQAQRESQAVRDDSSDEGRDMLVEEGPEKVVPEGTVYFSDNSSSFQDFSGFQYRNFQMNNCQSSTEHFQEEHIFQTGFLGPPDSSSLL